MDEDINDYCSYCLIDNEHTSNRETLEHFYGKCEKVQNFTRDVLKEKFNINNYSKDWNLLGVPSTFNIKDSAILNIEIMLINLFLLRFRFRQSIPTIHDYNSYFSLTKMILKRSKFYSTIYDKLSNFNNIPFDNG